MVCFRRPLLIALWLALALPGVGQAQTAAEPLPMGWTDLYPWFFRGPDGAVAGFGLELTKELGKAAGFEPAAVEFGTVPNWVAAQIAGQVILVPAVARLPAMEASSVFSDPLFETTVQLAIRIEDKGRFDPKDLSGRRIGVLPPAAGSDPALLPGATLFEYTNTRAALIGLLGGEIDAISAEATLVFAEARRARLDNRIAFVEEPLMTIARFILLHQSRADLLPAINAEIARMKADGRLEALITRFNIHLPEPEPEVLQIGVFDLPPHMSVRPDGSASGFAVEVLESVAKIAGLRTAVVPIDIQNFAPGDPHDILPIATITEDRQQAMDFAYPIEASTFSIFMRQGETAGVAGLSDLGDRAVGVISTSLAHNQATAAGLSNIVPYGPGKDVADMMADLDAGGIEAALFEATNVHELLADGALSDRIVEITPPFFISQRAPALRPGLGSVRERLNAVIPGYLVSDEYLALREKYFGTGAVWTKERLFWFGGLSAILALGALILVAGTQMRARTRTLAAEARAAQADRQAAYQGRFLEAIFNAATSGIVALNREGLVVRANRAARHILGGISQPTPFPWPAQIKFLEAETLHPLDASADPIRRALSGHTLRGETHLVRRLQKGDPQRYVRIDSAQLHIEDESDLAVLVIDDVSNEERNRQVVERKSRLDALGQLTGGIAHDFNNLLAAQLYAVDLARRASDPDKRENFLEIASGSIQRGRALTSRLLAFARKQPGLAAVRSVADVCEDFRKLVRPMLEAQFDITFTLDDPRLRVFCDQTQLETALMNMVLNSRDAFLQSGRGNRIDIKARSVRSASRELNARQIGAELLDEDPPHRQNASYRYVEILVSDNGPGMDDETLARCTDPFFTTKDSNSGTGLGLAMVYGFVRQSDGDLRIYSELGVGTSIQMTLPRGTETGTRETPMPEEELERGKGETILVVEDELQLLIIMVEILEYLGYKVVSAKSGIDAMDIIDAGTHFDLLLTDVVMPGQVGGFELARRARTRTPDLPVIYTSGYTGFTTSEMGEVQAPLLQKPAPPAELAKVIAAAFRAEEDER